MNLQELQKAFVNALDQRAMQIIPAIHKHQLSAEAHFAIYKNSIQGAKQNALKIIYPVCLKLVGEDFFIHMANQYIATTPSESPDLNAYGKTFPDFIQNFQPAASLPYLSDVAQLEWAWDKIDRISTQFSSPYPVHQIWETNQDDYTGDDIIQLENNLRYSFRIWRNGLKSEINIKIEKLNSKEVSSQ